MDTKAIFFDIDGTILSHRTGHISDSTKVAIRSARANGHLVLINSGRTYAEIDAGIKEIGFDGYVCGCGTYITFHGQELIRASLSEATCRTIVKDLRKYHIEALLEGTETIYYDQFTDFDTLIKQRERYIHKYHFHVQDWDAKELVFDKFCIWCDRPEKGTAFIQEYSELFDFIDREGRLYEAVPKGYSKATGIKYLLSYLNIPYENTYALGDGANDLSMLNYVNHSIGMGNCDRIVKDTVSFLTKDVDEDGVAYALRHYGII